MTKRNGVRKLKCAVHAQQQRAQQQLREDLDCLAFCYILLNHPFPISATSGVHSLPIIHPYTCLWPCFQQCHVYVPVKSSTDLR